MVRTARRSRTLLAVPRIPANAPENKARGIDAINVSRGFSDPYAGFQRLVDGRSHLCAAPIGV
jgi:hypothetical protein